MNDTRDSMNVTHLTSLMLLHYLAKFTKHQKCNITAGKKENCIRCIRASSQWTRVIMCFKLTYMMYYTASLYETKTRDINDLRKRLMQTCFDFDRNIINAGVTI